jgi:hypothetical protein
MRVPCRRQQARDIITGLFSTCTCFEYIMVSFVVYIKILCTLSLKYNFSTIIVHSINLKFVSLPRDTVCVYQVLNLSSLFTQARLIFKDPWSCTVRRHNNPTTQTMYTVHTKPVCNWWLIRVYYDHFL